MKAARAGAALVLAVAACRAPAQADFECQALGSIPMIGSAPDCEGLLAYNPAPVPKAYVSGQPACHFPTSGARYGVVVAHGPATPTPPPGGPFVRAGQPYVPELRIPAPTGATAVSFCFEFFRDWFSTFDDGFDVSIVDAAGNVIQNVAYADGSASYVYYGCTVTGFELAPPGPQSASATFAPLPAGCRLSVVCWNDYTNYSDAVVFIDHVQWANAPACPAAFPAPANDLCAAATPIGEGTVLGDTADATPAISTGVCGGKDVWFRYFPSCTGIATASLCTTDGGLSTFASTIGVHAGTCSSLVSLGCNSEQCTPTSHRVSFPVSAGAPVYVSVGGAFGSTGSFVLSIGCSASPPANDECTGAVGLASGWNGPFTLVGATQSAPQPACAIQNDVWFAWTPSVSSSVRFSLAGAFAPATQGLSISSGCAGPEIICATTSAIPGTVATTTLDVAAGTTYRIRVLGLLPAVPSGSFSVGVEPLWSLVFEAPLGLGSASVRSVNGSPGWPYFTAMTFAPNAIPGGWFFGLQIPLPELLLEVSWPGGLPFTAALDASGHSPPFVVPSGAPSGATVYGVSVEVNPVLGIAGRPTAPVAWIIP